MKLVCHIGTPKTASTFLQNTCAQNPEWLAQRAAVYPTLLAPDANHITLLFAALPKLSGFARGYGISDQDELEQFRTQLSDQIAQEIAAAPDGVDTMIMSSENLTGNMGLPGIRGLKALLAPHFSEIQILVYLRRQDDAILSMYGEFMRRGFSADTFPEFLEKALTPATAPPYLYCRRMLQEWAGVFGRDALTVRLFDREQFQGGAVLNDFLSQVFEAPDIDLTDLTPAGEANASLSAPALEFLRRLQPSLPHMKNGTENPRRGRLRGLIDKLPSKPRPYMSAAHSALIVEKFKAPNEWVRDQFFPDHSGPIFPARTDLPEESNLGHVNLSDFTAFAGELLQ